ncbi:Bro-N domain-containing protein [Pseudomonas lini]
MINATAIPIENNVQSRTAQIIPFKFGKQQVRTLLIDDQPWFVAADVSSALEYRIAGDMTRNLDEDEKGTQIVRTLGGEQEMLVINESGLYSAILRSRKLRRSVSKSG